MKNIKNIEKNFNTLPTIIQTKNRNHVNNDKWNIKPTLKRILKAGIKGTIGT